MSALSLARLLSRGPNGVYLIAGRLSAERCAALCRRNALECRQVQCREPCTRTTLMASFARDLEFPDYFGGNWDALLDCLTDLEWMPARGYVLWLRGLNGLARRSPRELALLLDVLTEAAGYRAEEAVPFYVLLEDGEALAGSGLPHITPR